MGLRKLKPVTNGTRGVILIDRSDLWKGEPIKYLTEGQHSAGGRNNHGHITSRHRGGGHKQRYRIVDFKRRKAGKAAVERIEYDPNRSAFIALVKYEDGSLAYILAPQRLAVGDAVEAGKDADIKPGNALPLASIPVGTIVHNVEMKFGAGGKLARSAGTYAQLIGRDQGFAQLRLSSGEMRVVPLECWASVGAVSNADHMNRQIGKAGRNRWRGIRPQSRGEVMNPVDHPHGGRTRGNRHPTTPWGKPTKGYKTRKNKATDKYIIRRRNATK